MVAIPKEYLSFKKGDITIEYTDKGKDFVEVTFNFISESVEFLTECFNIKETFPTRIILTPDRPDFDHYVKEVLKVDIEIPSNPVRIGQPQKTDLVILSPRVWEEYEYDADFYREFIIHEMTHIFEEYLSPNIEAVKRWWSEGLAIYLSGQYENRMKASVAEETKKGFIPSIHNMQGDTPITSDPVRLSYLWGWTMVKFIDSTYGKGMIQRIVRECHDGNVCKVLDENASDLENKWREWLMGGGLDAPP